MYNLLLFIYFIYIQVLPVTQDVVQIVLLGILIASSLLSFTRSASSFAKKTFSKDKSFLPFKIIIINSFVFTLFGLFTNQPGAGEYLFLETIFPIVYIAIFATDKSENMVKIMNTCFTIATFIIGMMFVLKLLNVGAVSDFLASLNDSPEIEGVAVTEEGKIAGLRFIPLYSISYLTSISIHNLANSIRDFFDKNPAKKTKSIFRSCAAITIHLFNFTSTLFCIILSGRQGLIVGFLGSLIIITAIQLVASSTRKYKNLKYVQQGKKHITLIFGMMLFFITLILLANIFVDFIRIDEEYIKVFLIKNGSDVERLTQLDSLTNSWHDSPIIGHGNGAAVSVIRNELRPWRYELGYILRLNNMGLLGTFIHLSGIFLICVSLIKNFYQTGKIVYMSSLGGLLSLLIADGTNPYMIRFTVLYYFYYCLWLATHRQDPIRHSTSYLLPGAKLNEK
jgi:hypothetical protein